MVKQILKEARLNAIVKLRRKSLFDELANGNYSSSVRETYIANKDQYLTPLQVDVSMIFLSRQKHSKETIKKQSELVYQQVKSGQVAFEKLALKYSNAPAVNTNKGDIGLIKRGDFDSKLDAVIFAEKKPGVISPVETKDGFFIIKINRIEPQRQLSLDEVKDVIKAKLLNELASQEWSQLVQSIVNDPENVVNQAAVEGFYHALKQSK